MVSGLTMAALVFNILCCFAVPIIILLVLVLKRQQIVRTLMISIITFAISQLLVRVSLNGMIAGSMSVWMQTSPWIYALVSAIIAGVLEEGGKFAGYKIAMRTPDQQRWVDGVTFGIGFAGVFNMLFSGVSHIANISAAMTLNSGGAQALVDKLGNLESANSFISGMAELPWYRVGLLGLHDLLWMAVQTALAVLILYGVRCKGGKSWLIVLCAAAAHLLLEGVVMVMGNVFGLNELLGEAYIAVLAAISIWFIIWSRTHLFPQPAGEGAQQDVEEAKFKLDGGRPED